MYFKLTILLVSFFTANVSGCGKGDPEGSSSSAAKVAANAPWVLQAEPGGAQGVAAAKQAAVEGDKITLRGKIGGRKDPLSKDSAVFVMMDSAIPSCADNPDDKCKTPWDYCCETPDLITANNASVMLVDHEGSARPIDLTEYGFLPLDEVVVVGTVRPRPTDAVLAIDATGIFKIKG